MTSPKDDTLTRVAVLEERLEGVKNWICDLNSHNAKDHDELHNDITRLDKKISIVVILVLCGILLDNTDGVLQYFLRLL